MNGHLSQHYNDLIQHAGYLHDNGDSLDEIVKTIAGEYHESRKRVAAAIDIYQRRRHARLERRAERRLRKK